MPQLSKRKEQQKELRRERKMLLQDFNRRIPVCAGLQFASDELRNDWDVVMEAVLVHAENFKYAGEKLRGDRETVKLLVSSHPYCLEYASEELRGDKEVVLTAMSKNYKALQYASEELRGDKEVVMVAVSKNGEALLYASEELRGDKEVVLTAVSKNYRALQYATGAVRGDKQVAMAAVSQHGLAIAWTAKELRDDPEVIELALANVPNHEKLWGLKVMLLSGRSCNVFWHGYYPPQLNFVLKQAALDLGLDEGHVVQNGVILHGTDDLQNKPLGPLAQEDWYELTLLLP